MTNEKKYRDKAGQAGPCDREGRAGLPADGATRRGPKRAAGKTAFTELPRMIGPDRVETARTRMVQ